MSKTSEGNETGSAGAGAGVKPNKSISLDPVVMAQGQARAVEENRNFSNYIETLILRDVERARREAERDEKAEAGEAEVRG